MECVIRKRKKGMIKPILEVNTKTNRGLMMLDDDDDDVKMEPLSPSSAAFHKPDFNIHVLAILGVKTPIDVDLLKAKFPSTLLKHPRFSSVVVGNSCKGEELKWVRTKVDLNKHFIVPKITIENLESPDTFLENYLYNLSETTLDKSRPLWELHILHLELDENIKGVGIFRIHHSLGDGTSLISLLLALTRKTSDPNALPTIPSQKTSDVENSSSSSNNNNNNNNNGIKTLFFWRWILMLWMNLQLFWNTLRDVILFGATALFLKDNSPFENSPRGPSAPRRIVYKILSLDDMKLVKNAMSCTINDVALGITQAGLSRYLSRKYGNDGNNNHEDVKIKKLLKDIMIRSVLLINIRPSGGIQALADMMEKDTEVKWGNSVGFVLLPFTIGLRDDPLDYIREAKNTVDRKKNSLEAIYTFFMADIIMKFFSSKVANAVSERINSHTTIGFSNLAGPLEEISFYGHPIAFIAPSSHGQPHGVLLNYQSYGNKMILVLTVDEHAVPDPHQMCDDIVQSLNLIKNTVMSKSLAKKHDITSIDC